MTLVIFVVCVMYIVYHNQCIIFGHRFENSGNVDICKNCGLIKRKIRHE